MKLSRMQSVLLAAVLSFAAAAAGRVAVSQAAASGAGDSAAQVKVPALDVISVKPNKSGSGGMSMGPLSATNVSVHMVLTQAFHLNDNQVVNEPEWAKSERFDIKAKVADADVVLASKLTQDEKRGYFQQVLKERFGLVMHRETRELPEYALIVAKGGAKIEEGKPDPNATDKRIRGGSRMSMDRGRMKFEDGGDGLDFLLQILSDQTGRTIVNKTGLTGKYSFTLTWSPQMGAGPRGSEQPGDASTPADAGPDLFTAIQEQLGLKLEPMKGPVDVVVIDHLERPGEN
jgi:uncharacterized protein (TIGR03435 family)